MIQRSTMASPLRLLTLLLTFCLLGLAIVAQAQTIRYVKQGSNGNSSGDSWENAIPELADALAWAKTNASNWTEANPLQIWVAAGEYQPANGASFEMVDHVRIYGGFAGTESTLDSRDWNVNRTTLRGNGSSVVRNPNGLALSRSARLDGFTITGGISHEGGGIYNWSDATFANLVITGNTATGSGGGVRNFASSLYYNILITDNTSSLGAGFFNTIATSKPVLVNVTSSGNDGDTAPELHVEAGNPIIRNSIFYGNGVSLGFGVREFDIQYSLVQGLTINRDGNIPRTTNPLFTDAANGDFSLSPASAAINSGSNQAYIDYIDALAGQLDLTGGARAQQGTIDMGALESPGVRVLVPAETSKVIYVDMNVDQWVDGYTGDGSSWANAVPDLWSALIWVRENANNWTGANPLQVWVAAGEYAPHRGLSFEMVDHVKIYGGFEGTETTLAERNLAGYTTALYGNGNSVVRNPEGLILSRNAVLDGFAIGGFGYPESEGAAPEGGGIYNSGDATFGNLYIMANTAATAGGGIYNTGSALFYDILIVGNNAPKGAGFYNASASSAPVLVNVTILGDFVPDGQVFYLEAGNPVIRNTFVYGGEVFGITDATDVQYSLIKGRMATDNGNIADVGFPLFDFAPIEAMMFPTSPTINTGSNQAYLDLVGPFGDQPGYFGFSRLQQGVIDMGAIETPFKRALTPDEDNIIYVNKTVDQTTTEYVADGSSWENAVPELADALLWARVKWQLGSFFPELKDVDPLKIYVAKGTYLPLYGADDDDFMLVDGGRDNAFVIVPNTMLYGGFDPENGITALTHQRIAPSIGGSMLSGNIGDVNSHMDNTHHVVIAANITADESLFVDGFTITGGYGDSDGEVWVNGQPISQGKGGGWYNTTGSLMIGRSMASKNATNVNRISYGADWLNKLGGNPVLTKLIADANRARPTNMTAGRNRTYQVNALADEGTAPILTNLIISGNTAEDGGGMYNSMSSPILTNVIISGNTATARGGAMYNELSTPTLTNVTISGNAAPDGGAIAGLGAVDMSTNIRNSVIWGNSSGILISDGLVNVAYSIVQGGQPGEGNLDTDPLFADAPSHTGAPFTDGDYRLQAGSPAINGGNNAVFELGQLPDLSAISTDLAGSPRIARSEVDMGVFESPYAIITALGAIPSITVPHGTALTAVPVPNPFTVEATLNGGTTEAITLAEDLTQWTVAAPAGGVYDGHMAGTYSFEMEIADDDANLNPLRLRATVNVIVEKGTPVITWESPESINYGTPLGDDQLNASSDVDGTFTYDPVAETVLTTGEHTLNVTFTPEDEANYNNASATVTLMVGKATPVINWATPATISYGTPLSDGQLNASADVDGTFTYTSAAGTILDAGNHTLEVIFTPDDEAYYSPATARVNITVNKATPEIGWDTPPPIRVGTALGSEQLNATVADDIDGTFAYEPAAGTVLSAGDHTLDVSFTPEDAGNYNMASATVDITVTEMLLPVVTWNNPATITYGTALGDDQLNATADVEGTFTYKPAAGTVLPAGDHALAVTFTPVDEANYSGTTAQVTLTVDKAAAAITTQDAQSYTYDGTTKQIAATLNHNEAELAYSPQQGYTDAGEYTITVSAPETANYNPTSRQVTLEITKSDWAGTPVTFPDIDPIVYDGNEHEITVDDVPPGSDVTYVIVDGDGNELPGNTVTDAGEYTVIAVIRQDNYEDITVSTPVTIAKALAIITADPLQTLTYDGTVKNTAASLNHGETTLDFSPQQGYTEAGEYSIVVSAPETANYRAATATAVTLHIDRAAWDGPAVVLPETPEFTYDGKPHPVTIINLPPGATAEYTVIDADGNIVPGNEVSETGEYTITVTVKQDNYHDVIISTTVTVKPGTRTLHFPSLQEKTYGDGNFDAKATASTGEVVSYISDNPAVATIIDGKLHIVGAGTATITATVPENPNYTDRPQVARQLVVRKAQQVITLNAPTTVDRDAGSIPLAATSSSNLRVTLSLDDPQVATLEGTALHIHRLGTVQITAVQSGDANHEPAEAVTATVRVIDPNSDLPVRISKVVSPNSDGINEFLLIEGIRDYPENKVTVFNRNGTILYEASGYNNGSIAFRGISTGQLPLPAGTYFYVAEIKTGGTWKHEKGWFVLRY